MSKVATKTVKLGDSADLSKNFLISVPAVPDGTLTIERENGTDVLTVDASGFVGISDGPKVKTKKLTGTTNGSTGATSSILHGVNASKILNVSVVVTEGTNRIPPGYADTTRYYTIVWDDSGVIISNGAGATNILAKPVVVFITYEA